MLTNYNLEKISCYLWSFEVEPKKYAFTVTKIVSAIEAKGEGKFLHLLEGLFKQRS